MTNRYRGLPLISLLLTASAFGGTGFEYETRCGTVDARSRATRAGVLLIGGA
ncbi:MAG: hypothetical protein AAGJ52_12195 [Pseudomonadota bacterium]